MPERASEDSTHDAIAAEHRRLGVLFGQARSALERDETGQEARAAFALLLEALEAHFAREESLYYPTIWALRPDLKGPLVELIDSHPQIRACLDAISRGLKEADLRDVERHFEDFVERFGQHEKAEERLLRSIAEEIDSAR